MVKAVHAKWKLVVRDEPALACGWFRRIELERLHGAAIGDNSLIGMSATLLNGSKIGKGSLVGAGALVPPGKVVPAGWLVMGVPAKAVRKMEAEAQQAYTGKIKELETQLQQSTQKLQAMQQRTPGQQASTILTPNHSASKIYNPSYYNYFLNSIEKEIKHEGTLLKRIKRKIDHFKDHQKDI